MVLGTEEERRAVLQQGTAARHGVPERAPGSKLLQCGCHGIKFVAAANEEERVVYFL
jgi:hypothetical protein